MALRIRSMPAAIAATLAVSLSTSATAQPADAPAAVEQHTEKAPGDELTKDETSLTATVGGSNASGNTRVYLLNAGADFRLVRHPHGFGASVVFAYGQADLPDDGADDYEETAKNLNAKARYDFFFTPYDAIFAASAFRWDEFAGLDARVQGQLGYLRYLLRQENHELWGEIGYDLTYDNYHPLPNKDFDDTMPEGPGNPAYIDDGDDVIHSARLFVGYENKLNAVLTYVGGLEGLMNVEEPKDTRLNFDNALRSAIADNLQLELKVSLRFDNVPVTGAEKLDTLTVVNLICSVI